MMVDGAGATEGSRSSPAGDTLAATLSVDAASATLIASDAPRATAATRASDTAALKRGDAVGRYVVLGPLGQGGMGVVYAAYDPELDRKVAVKLVLARRDDDPSAHVRLLREAQAMAQLAHPNVVTVHDVGTLGDRVWIAMEFVEGLTLSDWLGQRPRAWREVLQVFLRAGEGLQRAHTAGLVHRDFKPDNVMVSPDGRVRVMDFGLARADQPPARELPRETTPQDPGLTRAGALLGTPRYMAPEQWQRVNVDARSDQFAFCVALWEALYGVAPFRGESIVELANAVTLGEIGMVRDRRKVPLWLHRVLQRGLMPEPERRFPSVDALLRTIERRLAGSRSRRALLALAAVLLVGASAGLWQARQRVLQAAACEAAGAEIDAVWNDTTHAELRAALLATGLAYATSSADRIGPRIDRWTAEWARSRTQVCREAELTGARTPEHAALASACFDDRRDELVALLGVLVEADAAVLAHAVPAVAGLSLLAPCSEHAALERRPQPPADADTRVRVQTIRRDLMRAQGLLATGRYAEGLARVQALRTAAIATAYPPLIAETHALLGRLADQTGDGPLAEQSLGAAFRDGGAIAADEVAAAAAIELVFAVGYTSRRSGEALQWAQAAEMLVRRLGQERGLLGATLQNNLGVVHAMRGAYDEALACLTRAAEIRSEVLGPDHPRVGDTLGNLGELHRIKGDFAEAVALQQRVLALNEAVLGPDHPDTAVALNNLGIAELDRHDPDAALAALTRALAIWEQALGPAHANVANALTNIANAHTMRGDFAQALVVNAQAQTRWERAVGAADPRSAHNLRSRGDVFLLRGEHREALPLFERALAIQEKAMGPEHPDLVPTLDDLAVAHLALGAADQALPLLDRAITLAGQAYEPTHMTVLVPQVHRGLALIELGRAAEALPILERTLLAMPPDTTDPAALGETRFALARALKALAAPDKDRIDKLTRAAIAALRSAGPAQAMLLRTVEAWARVP